MNGTTPLTKEDKERAKQLKKALKASTQNTIKYTSLFEDGLMHIVDEEYSKTWELGDTNPETTGKWEEVLAQIGQGKIQKEAFVNKIKWAITKQIEKGKQL